jgi:hypothetical protein
MCYVVFTETTKRAAENNKGVRTMSEEQKKQVEDIAAEMNKLTPELREGALMYLQGMAACAKLMESKKDERKEA